jgi:hypothetical protein
MFQVTEVITRSFVFSIRGPSQFFSHRKEYSDGRSSYP